MILEVILWPESQKVAETPGWFFINGISDRTGGDSEYDPIGSAAYARILDEDEYTLTRDTKKVTETHRKIWKNAGTSVPVYNEGDAKIVERWVCYYCGENTYDVDYEYIGSCTNHLKCELDAELHPRNREKNGDDVAKVLGHMDEDGEFITESNTTSTIFSDEWLQKKNDD